MSVRAPVSGLDTLHPHAPVQVEGGEARIGGSAWKLAAYVFLENRLAVAGLVVVVVMFLFCFAGPLIYRTNQVTVVLNGKTIIDKGEVEGLTAIAIDANESQPGPIYLQGDHGPVEFRNLTVTPLVKK